MCAAAGVNCALPDTVSEGYKGCCVAEHRPIVQERAWSSPVWYSPASATDSGALGVSASRVNGSSN